MYDRAARVLTRPPTDSSPNLGPGTYQHSSLDKPAPGYAPFQSMTVRESFLTVGEQLAAAPGPGHYSPSLRLRNAQGASSLKNRSTRFYPVASTTPGPGAYAVPSQWAKKKKGTSKDVSKLSHVKFQRQGNPPSIPSGGINNGYEEDESGALKPQEVVPSDSTIGPAYYRIPHRETSAVLKYRGIHFGKLTSTRSIFNPMEGPGPSDYSPTVVGKTNPSHSSNFITTNIPRYHELVSKEEETKGVPGPGHYPLKSQFEKSTTVESGETEVPFGSHLQRFTDAKQTSPACTAYQDPRTALEVVSRLHGMRRTPFSQTSTRFKVNQDLVDYPGPGTYNDSYVTGMSSQVMRKVMAEGFRNCPFGSTSMRTVPLTRRDDLLMPGPADYERDGTTQRNKNRLSQAFASKSKRFTSGDPDEPSPFSYKVHEAYMNSQGKVDTNVLQTGFMSTSERFAPPRDITIEETDVSNPGPGEYDASAKTKLPGGVIDAEKPRFRMLKNTNPGPGEYELSKSQRDTVLKGTYNVSLSNPLVEHKTHIKQSPHKTKRTVVLGV